MKTDADYIKYIESKSLQELLEIEDQINKTALPRRYKIVSNRIEQLKLQQPIAFAEAIRDKKFDTIPRRIVSNIADGAIMWGIGWLTANYLKSPLNLSELYAESLTLLINIAYFFISLLGWGQTIGMRISEVKMLNIAESKASILNTFLYVTSNIGLAFALTFVAMNIFGDTRVTDNIVIIAFTTVNIGIATLNRKHRALTDIASNTVFVATKYVT